MNIDWQQVKALFDEALSLPQPERRAFVRAVTVDEAVRAEVLSLLDHDERAAAGRVLAQPATLMDLANDDLASEGRASQDAPSSAGRRIGAWTVTGMLGQGGMGEVLRARRADGAYEGEAAIKLLRRGMDSAALLARFAQEQRALARMNHPHIARLFDAGLTDDRRPYFVMELVEGSPIDRVCEGLPLEQRLDLFLQLADAVAHAHRQLLVHRDLKPGNVLVDASRQVKLLDFGIAKALDPAEADPGHTQAGERPFTPLYASPEQVRGEAVSTATDIYSLGVLLYVMLTGQRPYGRAATTPAEAARSVLEELPTRPSALTPGLGADPQWLATRDRLRGDLDNVLLKALDKSIEGRYASVEALATDIRAFLGGYPVSARAAGPWERGRKWVKRNPLASGALATAAMAVFAGLAVSLWQGREAAIARDAALRQLEQVKRLTTDLVFRYGDTVTTLPGGAAAQEPMLESTLSSLETALAGAPEDAEMQSLVASTLARLAEIRGSAQLASPERAAEAQRTVSRAIAAGEAVWARQSRDWRFASWHGRALVVQGELQRGRGELEPALATVQQAIDRNTEALGHQAQDPQARAYLLSGVANAWLLRSQILDHGNRPSLGRFEEGLKANREAERLFRALMAQTDLLAALDAGAVPGDPSTLAYLTHQVGTLAGSRAITLMRLDQLAAARAEIDAALVMRRANVQREPKNVAWRDGLMTELNTQAVILIRLAEWPAALKATEETLRVAEALAAEQGPQSKWAGVKPILASQHGRALAGNDLHVRAIEQFDLAIAHWQGPRQRSPGANPARRLAWHQSMRAASMAALGQRPAALAMAQEAERAQAALADDPAVGRDARLNRAETLLLMADLQPANGQEHRSRARAILLALQAARPLAQDQLRLLRAASPAGGENSPASR